MSIKYLSSSGLTEVWSNIKAYIASKIPSKIITGLSINGKTITYTNSDGTTGTLTTQDTNTDTKVTQTVTTTNAEYPVLFSTDANKTATSTTTARFSSNIKINPNTNTITATTFKGNLSGTATKATQDASGNVITNTYATKSELTTKADDANVVHKSGTETIVGTKTFSNVTYSNKELRYKDTKYDWTNTSLDTWCDAGHVSWFDKTGNRRMHELVGTKGGVWRKACYINENIYFSVDSNRYISYWGYVTFTNDTWFNGNSFLKMTNLKSNTTTPTSAQYKHINVIANDGSQVSGIQFAKRSDGSFDTTIYSHGGASGNSNYGTLRITSNNEVYPLNNKSKLGTTGVKWSEVWAKTFNGNLVAKQINTSDSSSLLRIFGGTAPSTGANLDLHGENESTHGGNFILRARNSSGYKALIGKIDGTLTWDGKTVLTAGNGVTLDTAQTITGEKTFSKTVHVENITNYPAHNLWVYTGDLNATYGKINIRLDGTITLYCVNTTTKKSSQMDLKPDGTLTWGGKHIVRTVNGIGANQEGNVNLTNILGFTPVQQGGGTGQLNNKVYIGWTGSQLKCTVNKTDLGAFVFEGRAQVGTTITAYWGSSSSTGIIWETVGGLNGTKRVSSTSITFTPVVGQIYSGDQLYSTANPNGGVGATNEPDRAPKAVYARLNLSGAFNSSYKYLCTTAVGVNATASVYVTGHTASSSAGPYTTITGYKDFTQTLQGGKSTFLRVQ